MKYLISDPVLENFTWRGTEEKRSFKKLELLNDLIFKSVRSQFKNYKVSEYCKYMVEWLKHAKTRQRTVSYSYPTNRKEKNYVEDENDDEE